MPEEATRHRVAVWTEELTRQRAAATAAAESGSDGGSGHVAWSVTLRHKTHTCMDAPRVRPVDLLQGSGESADSVVVVRAGGHARDALLPLLASDCSVSSGGGDADVELLTLDDLHEDDDVRKVIRRTGSPELVVRVEG